MTPDLFAATDQASPSDYHEALAAWLAAAEQAGTLKRDSSIEVYQHMWSAFTVWAVGNGLAIDTLRAEDLESYLESRGGADELSARYAWRFLRLVGRVLGLRRRAGAPARAINDPVEILLARRPDIRFANAAAADPLPEFLPASEAKLLVTYLSAVRPGRSAAAQQWSEVRNRASIGLMLGAGVTPGEIRSLELDDVVVDGGHSKGVPWKLRVDGNGNAPARETPIARWAGQLLQYWLQVRSEQRVPGQMVFPSTKSTGKPWGKVAQYNAACEVFRSAGIDDVAGGSFRLRHTFALRQLKRGRAPEDVARWLGVIDPAVMARYQRVITAPIDVV
ncbi:MAG: site-specific integrase [Vitreoscilla sp.]|nr:site-specific integrase [Vitreoscilla sp.]